MADVESFSLKRNGNGLAHNGTATAAEARAQTLKRLIPRSVFFLQIVADILVTAGSMLLGFWFYHLVFAKMGIGKGEQPLDMYLRLTLITIVILLLILERKGLYRRTMSIMNIEEVKGIFTSVLYAAVILFTASFYFKDITYSRLIVTYSFIFLLVFLTVERYVAYKIFQYLHGKGIGVQRVLIYGAGEAGQMLVERFVRSPRLGTMPLGFLDDNPELWGKTVKSRSDEVKYDLPVFGGFEKLLDTAVAGDVDELFISLPSVSQTRIAEIIRYCERINLKFNFMPNLYDYKLQHISVRSLDGIPLLTVKERHIAPWNFFLKRIMDIIIASAAILVLSPVFIIIARLVKKGSPGPALFKQDRVGREGEIFSMYKFRTMYVDTPKYALTPDSSEDPRITPLGRLLRRTSLDELPQLFNVLKGEMSVVGPRPEMPFIVEQYNQIQRERLKVKPGITGLWQISADRAKQIHENIEYDLYYVENVSPLLDLVIILRTVIGVIRGRGAF